MIASEHVATLGTRSTISGWAAISPSRKSSRFARHRVHRHPDYPASLGLDRFSPHSSGTFRIKSEPIVVVDGKALEGAEAAQVVKRLYDGVRQHPKAGQLWQEWRGK